MLVEIDGYYVGEKPPPTTVRYEDENGDLISSISGATITAITSINGAANVIVSCSNNGDGTFTIDWPSGADDSVFTEAGTMKIQFNIVHGDYDYYLKPAISIPVWEG